MHTVAVDASVLINFLLLNRVDILGAISGYRFVVADAVHKEITRPDQQTLLSDAFDASLLQKQKGADPSELRIFADLTEVMGVGEAACLATAEYRGWLLASDERGLFLRIARERIGEHRILTTPEILLRAIRAGIITVEQADEAKAYLEKNRFRMKFDSFADL
ncbi:MAG: hypothetical protein F4Y00_01905 [Bacteroidetes bacterium SB0662_bin_6]|nr:hypothetical protein [Bacteroidetes bacterium SB0668_bin_1]MYE03718.1 hypothetical protein [Bacteroidetes bacterium SB0662_bin_6]